MMAPSHLTSWLPEPRRPATSQVSTTSNLDLLTKNIFALGMPVASSIIGPSASSLAIDGAAHEGPLDLVATALEGGLAPDLEVAVGLLDGLAGNGAGAAATAHDDARVIEVDLLGEVLVHTACGHGVDLGADHHVPADGGVDGGDGLENLDRLHGTGVLAAELKREGEAEDALVDEDVDRFVGQTAQLLGLVAAFADYLGELAHTLKRGAFERG